MTKVSAQLTTKGVYARRRCRSCRNWFAPQPGGRPALFYSASCKQRAYKARKKERASPCYPSDCAENWDASPRQYVFVTSVNRPIFTPENAKVLFQNCAGVRPSEETDYDKVAEELGLIAMWCVSACHQRMAPTSGEDQKWFLKRAGHCSLDYFRFRCEWTHRSSKSARNNQLDFECSASPPMPHFRATISTFGIGWRSKLALVKC